MSAALTANIAEISDPALRAAGLLEVLKTAQGLVEQLSADLSDVLQINRQLIEAIDSAQAQLEMSAPFTDACGFAITTLINARARAREAL